MKSIPDKIKLDDEKQLNQLNQTGWDIGDINNVKNVQTQLLYFTKVHYPDVSSKLKVKADAQGFYVIVPGEDRVYAVFDNDNKTFEILGESDYLPKSSTTSFKQFLDESAERKNHINLNEDAVSSLERAVNAIINAANVVQTAHWNLRSSAFVAIHPWFGETYVSLFTMADEVAEQIKIDNIDYIVNVNRGETSSVSGEQELFDMVGNSLNRVKVSLEIASGDKTLSRHLHGSIDDWMSSISKMIWFIKASTK